MDRIVRDPRMRHQFGTSIVETILHPDLAPVTKPEGPQKSEQKRTGTAISNSAAQASRLGMQHASVAARYQLGGMAGGALVGYGTTGSIDGALMGASFGQMGGSIAAHFAVTKKNRHSD
jgi:hypothetical protein